MEPLRPPVPTAVMVDRVGSCWWLAVVVVVHRFFVGALDAVLPSLGFFAFIRARTNLGRDLQPSATIRSKSAITIALLAVDH